MQAHIPVTRRRLVFALSVVLGAWALPASAGKTAEVALGELNAKGASGNSSLARLFETSVERELSRLDLSRAKRHDRFVLSATLMSVASTKRADGAEARAVVSATLRKAQGGELHAIVRGSATATDAAAASSHAERAALQAAVKSALKRVPEALR
jgi:hypothetical protein